MEPIALLSMPQSNFPLNAMVPLRPGNEPSAGDAVSNIRVTRLAAATRQPLALVGASRDGCIAPLPSVGDRLSHEARPQTSRARAVAQSRIRSPRCCLEA